MLKCLKEAQADLGGVPTVHEGMLPQLQNSVDQAYTVCRKRVSLERAFLDIVGPR